MMWLMLDLPEAVVVSRVHVTCPNAMPADMVTEPRTVCPGLPADRATACYRRGPTLVVG
jgi:hypothetical protein